MMGRRQKLISGLEEDIIYGRHIYCYLKNTPSIVKWGKRHLNKRYRREGKKESVDE